jgi:cytochrome c553
MKAINSTVAILAIVSASVFASPGQAQHCRGASDVELVAIGEKVAQRNCAWCHGPSVQGYALAPRLAGQHPEYIELQIDRLQNDTRDNPFSRKYMSHVAAAVTPEKVCELAAYFAALPPEPAANGDESLVGAGEQIYREGVPSANVPACAFCHGPGAQGVGIIPRLGGQSYYYIKRRLQQWGEGYSKVAEHMPGIASKLSAQQEDALASYLSFIK